MDRIICGYCNRAGLELQYELVLRYDYRNGKETMDRLRYCSPNCVMAKIHRHRNYHPASMASLNTTRFLTVYGIKHVVVPSPDRDLRQDVAGPSGLSDEDYQRKIDQGVLVRIEYAPLSSPQHSVQEMSIPHPQTLYEHETTCMNTQQPIQYQLTSNVQADDHRENQHMTRQHSSSQAVTAAGKNTIAICPPSVTGGVGKALDANRLPCLDQLISQSNNNKTNSSCSTATNLHPLSFCRV